MSLDARRSCNGLKDIGNLGGSSRSTIRPEQSLEGGSLWQPFNVEDDMCRIDDTDDFEVGASIKFKHTLLSSDCNQVKKSYSIFLNLKYSPSLVTIFVRHSRFATNVLHCLLCAEF